MKFLFLSLLLLLNLCWLTSCNRPQQVKAKIIERKHLPDNQLQLKYRFEFKGNQITDSLTVDNHVLGTDSLTVIINSENPLKSKVELQK